MKVAATNLLREIDGMAANKVGPCWFGHFDVCEIHEPKGNEGHPDQSGPAVVVEWAPLRKRAEELRRIVMGLPG